MADVSIFKETRTPSIWFLIYDENKRIKRRRGIDFWWECESILSICHGEHFQRETVYWQSRSRDHTCGCQCPFSAQYTILWNTGQNKKAIDPAVSVHPASLSAQGALLEKKDHIAESFLPTVYVGTMILLVLLYYENKGGTSGTYNSKRCCWI